MADENAPTQDGSEEQRQIWEQLRGAADASARIAKLRPMVPGYKIGEILGFGGMGTVWRARQHGTERDVAIKVLNNDRVDATAPARFMREVELASQLQHPNIARVYESHVNEGNYYYAMELIDGVPLDRHVRDKQLDRSAILLLMQTICEAVQHAHFKGIIHRDLKPSNILVTDDGQPRLLDFGLARPITPGRGAKVSVEGTGRAGTPAYMSPEQAAARTDQIDTRSDVYSLGKILYELLVGQPAHDLSGTEFDLMQRVVKEDVRRPRQLNPSLDADLEAVLLKALDGEPRNRYASAGELSKDLAHIIRGDPVSARPATVRYFLGKKVARHRPAVLAVLAFTLAAAGLIVFSGFRVTHERNIAVAEQLRADNERADAEREAATSRAINEFFQMVLAALNPKTMLGVRLVGRDVMENADHALAERFSKDPRMEASIRVALGRAMLTLGQYAESETQLGKAVTLLTTDSSAKHIPVPETETLEAMDLLNQSRRENGNASAAEHSARNIADRYQTLFGKTDARTLAAIDTLAEILNDVGRGEEAADKTRAALELAGGVEKPDDFSARRFNPSLLKLAMTLSRILRERDEDAKLSEAAAWSERVFNAYWNQKAPGVSPPAPDSAQISRVPMDAIILQILHDRACAYSAQRRWDLAISWHRFAVASGEELFGAYDNDLVIWRNDLAAALAGRGTATDLVESESIYLAIYPTSIRLRGEDHRYTISILNGLANVLAREEKWTEAQACYIKLNDQAAAAIERLSNNEPDDRQILWFFDIKAPALTFLRKFDEAEAVYLEAAGRRGKLLGPNHRETLRTQLNLAKMYKIAKRPREARSVLEKTLAACVGALPPCDRLTAEVKDALQSVDSTR